MVISRQHACILRGSLVAIVALAGGVYLAYGQSPVPRLSAPSPTTSRLAVQRPAVRLAQQPSPAESLPAPSGGRPPVEVLPAPNPALSGAAEVGSPGEGSAVFGINGNPVSSADPSAAAPSTAETLPESYVVPLNNGSASQLQLRADNGNISLMARGAPLQDVLTLIAESYGLNLVTAEGMTSTLTVTLENVPLEIALDAILSVSGYTWVRRSGILMVTSTSTPVAADLQGREVEAFPLDFISAADLNTVVTGMLSPVGRAYSMISAADNSRRTQETLVVEDLSRNLERIRRYIQTVDQPPRQVLIEAYILQVDLNDDCRHGVNFEHLFNLSGNGLTLETTGFANPAASQAVFFNISGGNLTSVLEILRTTASAKTLASPKITVLNGQLARLQVGEQLGFRVTTTTETSTTESVEFLDLGVVLEVTPRISWDGRVLMHVRPEVSSGSVNPTTGLPEEETTELETDVMLRDNEGLVVGGLIQETDTDNQNKIPWLGDLHYVGKLFQRKEAVKNRAEIIVVLMPHILPLNPQLQQRHDSELMQAQTPLFSGPLCRLPRPWEAALPDSVDRPIYWGGDYLQRRWYDPCAGCEKSPCQCDPGPAGAPWPNQAPAGGAPAPEPLPPAPYTSVGEHEPPPVHVSRRQRLVRTPTPYPPPAPWPAPTAGNVLR